MTEYERVVLVSSLRNDSRKAQVSRQLDADMLCLQNMDELFEIDLPFDANVKLEEGVLPGPSIAANHACVCNTPAKFGLPGWYASSQMFVCSQLITGFQRTVPIRQSKIPNLRAPSTDLNGRFSTRASSFFNQIKRSLTAWSSSFTPRPRFKSFSFRIKISWPFGLYVLLLSLLTYN
jgi:hypothetical protein